MPVLYGCIFKHIDPSSVVAFRGVSVTDYTPDFREAVKILAFLRWKYKIIMSIGPIKFVSHQIYIFEFMYQ